MQKIAGFTLIEFLIAMVLTAIFLALAVPSYYSTIQNNKVVSVVNEMSAGVHLARMESIRRGVRVIVCAANSSLTGCGSAAQWTQGWLIFIDPNNNNNIDTQADIIRIHEALPTNVAITANNALVSFDSSGFLTSGAFTMTVNAPGCRGDNVRIINISASGRLSLSRGLCS
ncbi:type IV pre-pilin [Legionella busanensis]|uniref:Type II secretion system protein H n=1 Tax=Legionella busanensis TaxID=190655 RepID=A0A378JM34_9GAMM|nr:GspH/FimT family pseudopilin [Legionella busanensis]STX51363.1 type IV pre-pilin [Legionella busanensis]